MIIPHLLRFIFITPSLILLSCSATIEKFPDLKSNFAVGRTKIDILSQRDSIFQKGEKRKFFVEIYYPAKIQKNPANYSSVFRPKEEEGLELFLDRIQTKFPKSNFRSLSTHTYIDAPNLNLGKFPIILFEPGRDYSSGMYLNIYENLVSSGFIVIAIDHSYDSAVSVLNSGEIFTIPEEIQDSYKHAEEINDFSELSERVSQLDKTRLDDVREVLNLIPLWNKTNTILRNTLDETSIGILGHSYGGKISLILNGNEPKIKCAVSLDSLIKNFGNADILSEEAQKAFYQTKPFLILLSRDTFHRDYLGIDPKENNEAFLNALTEEPDIHQHIRFMRDTKHLSYMDTGYLIPWFRKNRVFGEIDPLEFYSKLNQTLNLFFTIHLKKNPNSQLDFNKLIDNDPFEQIDN